MVNRSFLPGVHALRAIAAVLVLFQHAVAHSFNDPADYKNEFPINYGRLGVAVFFSITGFLIMRNRHKSIVEFVVHRAVRIYPIYWITIVLTFASLYAIGIKTAPSVWAVALLPARAANLAIPYWTLIYEVAFYTVAAIVFACKLSERMLSFGCCAWILIVHLFSGYATDTNILAFPGVQILWSPIIQIIPMGCLLALHFNQSQTIHSHIWLTIAVVSFTISYRFPDPTAARHLFLGIATTSLVAAVCQIKYPPAWLVSAGYASYGLYLIHDAVMEFAKPFVLSFPFATQLAFYLITATVIGISYGFFDDWLHRKIIDIWRSSKGRAWVIDLSPGSQS